MVHQGHVLAFGAMARIWKSSHSNAQGLCSQALLVKEGRPASHRPHRETDNDEMIKLKGSDRLAKN